MAKAVPEHLRRIALRKLWSSNPVLACLDGLNDYEDDYTDAALAVKTLATNYKVGRGFRPLDDEAAPVATATSPDAAEDAQSDDDIAAADHDEAEAASAATETALSSSLRAPEEVRDETPEASRDAADPSPERLAERTEAPIPARRARIRFHQAD
jgi:hypothetical protein